MNCDTDIANALEIDWERIDSIISGVWETAEVQTTEIFGEDRYLFQTPEGPELDHELRLKEIFFKETLRFLYNVQLKNVRAYTKPIRDRDTIPKGEKKVQDHLADLIDPDGVSVFD